MSEVAPLIPTGARPAGFWIRAAAVALDLAIVFMTSVLAALLLILAFGGVRDPSPGPASQLRFLLTILVSKLVVAFAIHKWGGSPGKLILGLQVEKQEGEGTPSFGKAFGRETIGLMVSSFFLAGFISAALRQDKRAYHDRMFGTQVRHRRRPGALLLSLGPCLGLYVLMVLALIASDYWG